MQAQPSSAEIQHEFAALRDIRRRTSENHAAGNTLDPDLPEPQHQRDSAIYSAYGTPPLTDGESSSSHSHEASSNQHSSVNGSVPAVPSDDPFHLFWVPARLHPEIAPTEFRAFLKEHARGPPPGTEADGALSTTTGSQSETGIGLSRAPSSGLSRRPSLLSRQYEPSSADVSEERVVPSVKRSNSRRPVAADLTIADLQRLDQLAEEAASSSDPKKLRGLLRRSMSLGVPLAALNTDVPATAAEEDDDDPNSPIVVPLPGQILRRTARTKIRKPSLPGDGGGHRFQPSKRNRSATSPPTSPPEPSPPVPAIPPISPRSSSFSHGTSAWSDRTSFTSEPDTSITSVSGLEVETQSTDGHTEEDVSISEENDIYDAYVPDVASNSTVPASLPAGAWAPGKTHLPQAHHQPYSTQTQGPASSPAVTPVVTIQHPEPVSVRPYPARTSGFEVRRERSPEPLSSASSTHLSSSPKSSTSSRRSPSPTPPNGVSKPPKDKDKDKKSGGLFSKWGSSDKAPKRSKTAPTADPAFELAPAKEKEKEKEVGFFGALFSKKKADGGDSSSGSGAATSRYTATSPQPGGPVNGAKFADGSDGYSRYPLHVERAIYRLSHIKLANPRRPLYEQVLISNLMFWYLGVINAGNKEKENATKPAEDAKVIGGEAGTADHQQAQQAQLREQQLREEREAEERQREHEMREREREARERAEHEAREREERERMERQQPRRNPLSKSNSSGGARRAERPIKAPTYSMQAQVMEQQYGGGGDWASDSGERQREHHRRDREPHHQRQPVMPQYYLPPLAPSTPLNGTSNLDLEWLANPSPTSAPPPATSGRTRSRSPPPPGDSHRPRRTVSTSSASAQLPPLRAVYPETQSQQRQNAAQLQQQNGHHVPASAKNSAKLHKSSPPPTRNRLRSNDGAKIASDDVWKR